MNHLLYLAFKKSKLNRLIYAARRNKCHQLVEINAENIRSSEQLLRTLQPDPRLSCICENSLSEAPRFDLQIIVPAYNVEKYIEDCLDSVLTQQTSFSYIVKVIDDGSTDSTAKILKHYNRIPQLQIIRQANKGFSGARNTGLKNIDARYVMFLDSDDKLASGAIQALLEMADKTGADIVEGSSIKFCGPIITKKYIHSDQQETDAANLRGFAWGKVYKADLFARVHFPESYWFEDTLCSLILHPMAKKVSTVAHRVYCYRTNFKGISRNFRGKPKVLDSYYVSAQLLKDKVTLGQTLESDWREKIARQFKLDANRIASLEREDVNKAVFILQSNLFRYYFPVFKECQSALTQALWKGDYLAFKLQVIWL